MGNHIDLNMMLDVAEYFEKREDVRIVFIGTGINRAVIDERENELGNVQWIGWIDHSEMPSAWASSYLTFWAVHDNELNRLSFQSKLYEALASGVPPVVAVEGIIADILEANNLGVTVPFGAKKVFIQAIEQLLDNPTEREQLSHNARQYALENFDPHDVASRYENVLKESAR